MGQAQLDDGKEIGFFEFHSASPHVENRRVSFSAILKKLALDDILDAAIASFYYPDATGIWRLSFVGIEYDQGKTTISNLKRYSYVLGEDIAIKTAIEQLSTIHQPNMKEIEEAFSVERVSKEFFEKYKNLYHELHDALLPQRAYFQDEKGINLYAKKLLGRVVFLYFLQKKGWLGSHESWGSGDKKFISNLFAGEKYDNFYFDMLQPIFFEALNEKRADDHFALLGCKMPFLNGGLFAKDAFDKEDIIIENSILKKIFDLFDAYNFTIIEDVPHDSEVAIDPEMLGRVFEDLLEDRKEKGAFYTPREIVHYMSKKSIENYLDTHIREDKYDFSVEDFLHKTTLSDDEVLEFYKKHPVKFVKIDNYFTKLQPYKSLVIDFYIVAKLRGFLLNSNAERTKGKRGHLEITTDIWKKILTNDYEVVSVSFGSNKEIKLKKTYKYPTILKYIKIEDRYFILAFLPNVWGDLELTTIFPTRYKEIKRKLKIFDKSLQEINEENFAFKGEAYQKIKELQEDCRSLHAEPLSLFQVEELPRQAVAQVIKQGLSAFYNSFTTNSLTDESLKALLEDKNYYNKFINRLLSNSTIPQDRLKKIMIAVLKKIKVLDPAIGSGAFPMGVLHEIIGARVHLGDKTPLSKMKREIIENSIYGVDIEPSAVEIAKLRFWLSIVVDEETPTPLPNLAYKIMVGNSLLESINGFDPLDTQDGSLFGDSYQIETLQEKFHAYFKEYDNGRKAKLQEQIDAIIDEVLDAQIAKREDETQSYLANADLFSFNKREIKNIERANEDIALLSKARKRPTTELFYYKLYFAEVMDAGGFHIVIGNPPYVRHEKIKAIKERLKTEGYQSYNGTADLYIYFFEQGFRLLKENGILSYITSNKYTRAKYGKEFRKFVLANTNILDYIDFNGVKVFESATVDTSILSYKKSQEKNSSFIYCDVNEKYKKESELEKFIDEKGFEYLQSDLNVDSFSFATQKELAIKKRIEKVGTPLKEWDIEIYRGISTGYNKAFIIQEDIRTKLINKNIINKNIIKNLVKGRGLNKYYTEPKNEYLIYVPWTFDVKKYSDIYNYLLNFKEDMEKRPEVKEGRYPWYAMSRYNSQSSDEFDKEKIVWQRVTKEPTFSIVDNISYILDSLAFITDKNNSLKYLISLLNSKTISFYINKITHQYSNTGYLLSNQFVKQLPIPKISKEAQKPFEILVDYVMFAKKHEMNLEASLFESIIDGMVYDLYFEEEMKKADCFISDEVINVIGEFDSDNISEVYKRFNDNKTIQRGLIYSRVISVVKVINGGYK